jgi:hypothetical protein
MQSGWQTANLPVLAIPLNQKAKPRVGAVDSDWREVGEFAGHC